LAGELVLGVLDTAARREAQARSSTDPAFAQRVADWERRLEPWLSDIPPVEAPPHVWDRVCLRLGWGQDEPRQSRLWRSLAFWRAAAIVSILLAVGGWWLAEASKLTQPPVAAETGAKRVTPLAHDDGTPGWLASVDVARGTVLMVPVPTSPDSQGRVPELWLIPAGQAPRSLGAVSIDKSHTVNVPADIRAALVAGSVLAVTLEPPAGLPHAAPSGPIIAKGAIRT
jgi:anti-sigma-K factor RskA